jgi:hypothetical protein
MKPLASFRIFILTVLCAAGLSAPSTGEELNPLSLTKYLDAVPISGVMSQAAPNHYVIGMWQTQQQLHSQLSPTTYGGTEPPKRRRATPPPRLKLFGVCRLLCAGQTTSR